MVFSHWWGGACGMLCRWPISAVSQICDLCTINVNITQEWISPFFFKYSCAFYGQNQDIWIPSIFRTTIFLCNSRTKELITFIPFIIVIAKSWFQFESCECSLEEFSGVNSKIVWCRKQDSLPKGNKEIQLKWRVLRLESLYNT